MKRSRNPIKPAALLLVLLGLLLGGWGLLSVVFPGLAPARLTAAWRQAEAGEKGTTDEIYGKGSGNGNTAAAEKQRVGGGGDIGYPDPGALPRGLTSIDGEGGTGINRAVKKNGVWFPVYSPGPNPGSGPPPLTVIPLSIASGSPPPGRVNETFLYQAEAIGGTPPYAWNAVWPVPDEAFSLGTGDGLLTGLSRQPTKLEVQLSVTDAAGAKDSAKLQVVIRPEQELAIETAELTTFAPGEPVSAALTAAGGVPPYQWSIAGDLPDGLSLDASAGRIIGVTSEAGEYPIVIQVADAQDVVVEKALTLICQEGLTIETPGALPPAAPGRGYSLDFKATGGQAPYLWELTGGALPDKSWKLSESGILIGQSGTVELLAEFTLTVTDVTEARFEKTFRLAVSDLLILVPSREKVGVAWNPAAVAGLLAGRGERLIGVTVFRDGYPVYDGRKDNNTGSNFVDRGIPSGATPRYTLTALTGGGGQQPVAEKEVAVLPQILTRAGPGATGDPFADRVISFLPLSRGGYGSSSVPRNVTGPPDGRSTYSPAYKPGEVLSLHASRGGGGSIELEFTDNIVEIGPGEDLTVFENVLFVGGNGNQRFMEPALVSVALFPGEWHRLSCDVVPPAAGQALDLKDPYYYARGIAGRNGTTGSDPTNPRASGGDSLDLDEVAARAGLSWIRYIKIQSTGDTVLRDDVGGEVIRHPDDPAFNPLSGTGSSGFDLDAVSAVHY